MVRTLLIRGMLVGVVAGLLTFVVAKLVGEPLVDRAIAFEEQMDLAKEAHVHGAQAADAHTTMAAQHDHGDEALVSRGVQSTIGLATGVIVYGAAVGGLFALVFAAVYGRIGAFGPRATAALLAGAAFLVIFLVPAIKYPPNPPAVGMAETIGLRTGLFFVMILCSLAAFAGALALGRRLVARLGTWNAVLLGGAFFIVVIAAIQLLLPAINEVPDGFPAAVLWRFRTTSIGMQVIMWTVIGLLFGALAERQLGRQRTAF